MIRIENKRYYSGDGIYIGRPSLLSNPFVIGRDGTRLEVVAQYRSWLWQQIKLRDNVYCELNHIAELARRGDVTLICWCKVPGHVVPCHGDIIKSAAEWIGRQNSSVIVPNTAIKPVLRQSFDTGLGAMPRAHRYWFALLSEPI